MEAVARPRPRVSRIQLAAPGSVDGILYGQVPSKSNQRRIFNNRSIKSQKALNFVGMVRVAARPAFPRGRLKGASSQNDIKVGLLPLVLTAVVYGDSWQRDLDVELLPDALQAAGVITNDRAIREKHYWWRLDQENPRIEFQLRFQEREA